MYLLNWRVRGIREGLLLRCAQEGRDVGRGRSVGGHRQWAQQGGKAEPDSSGNEEPREMRD